MALGLSSHTCSGGSWNGEKEHEIIVDCSVWFAYSTHKPGRLLVLGNAWMY